MKLTRMTLATASSVLLLSALAGCGGASDDTATDTTDQAAAQTQPQGQMPQGGGFPGASGLVAAVDGTTAQVQNAQSGQVAVSWTSDTTFTQEVDATLDDVTVGTFVMVTNNDDDTAASVRIMPDGAPMPGGGDRPDDAPTDMPSDMPSDLPDRPDFGTAGEVTAVSADGFTITSNDEEVTVTVTGDTTYTTTGDATADAVKAGVCVSAQGDSDDTGAVTASSISVTKAVDGECGFRMGPS